MTPTQLESDVRDALRSRAAELGPEAPARLRRIDYHPRSRRIRPQLAGGAVVGAAGATGAAVAIVGLGTGAASAFAGWSARPTAASPAQIAGAVAACRARFADAPTPPPPAVPPGKLPVRLVDTRGPFTFVIFANARANSSCITGPGFVSLSGTWRSGPASPGADQLELSTSHTSRNGHPFTFAKGQVGAKVRTVALKLSDGRIVRATVEHGWFVAWWPGSSNLVSITVTTPAGTRTVRPGRPSAPPGSSFGSVMSGGRAAHGTRIVHSETLNSIRP